MTPRSHRWMSIQYKLPLLTTALLLGLVAVGAWAAYREVRDSALEANRGNLERAARELAGLIDRGAAPRIERMAALGENPTIRASLAGDSTAAIAALRELHDIDDDSFAIELRHPDGRVAARTGRFPAGWSAAAIDSVRRPDPATTGYSGLRIVGGEAWAWLVAPLVADDDTVGRIVQLLAVGDSGSAGVGELLGPGFRIYYVNRDGGPWVTLDGSIVDAPFPDPSAPPTEHARPGDGVPAIAVVAPSSVSDLSIVAEAPIERVLAGPRAFLRRAIVAAAALALIGAILVWLFSRTITRPLLQLARAANVIRGQENAPEVRVDRADELGDLADAFNRMAREIQEAQTALRLQVSEAEASRADADRANRAKSDFLATMSHEIRTPINAIIGYTDLLLLGVPEPLSARQRQQMERVQASGQYLLRLIDEVLDLSRIEAGGLSVREQTGNADDAIAAALQVTAAAAADKGVHVRHAQSEGGVGFAGDRHRVEQILVNLLSNAIKFTPAGGSVEVGATMQGSETHLFVRDTGIGISDEQKQRIFEPFVQADQSYTRSYRGVGLGLAISRELARLMGGDIEVRSAPGAGSTFTLRLPRANAGIVAA